MHPLGLACAAARSAGFRYALPHHRRMLRQSQISLYGRTDLGHSVRGPLLGLQQQRRLQCTESAPGIPTIQLNSPPPTTAPSAPAPARRSLPRRILYTLLIALSCTAIGFTMAAAPAMSVANEYLSPPTDEETLALYDPQPSDPSYAVNQHILTHPLAVQLFSDPTFAGARPHLKIPPSMREYNLTGGTLLGPQKIEVPPLTFQTRSLSPSSPASPDSPFLPELISLQYLGPALCGHPGIIHGGLLATLLDEGLARCCFPALPNKVGVTASLKIDYRAPCKAGGYVVLRARTTRVEGRKAWVTGRLETLVGEGETPTVLVEAEALFVEPRQAATMARVYSTQ